jgi:hypothetical protein
MAATANSAAVHWHGTKLVEMFAGDQHTSIPLFNYSSCSIETQAISIQKKSAILGLGITGRVRVLLQNRFW